MYVVNLHCTDRTNHLSVIRLRIWLTHKCSCPSHTTFSVWVKPNRPCKFTRICNWFNYLEKIARGKHFPVQQLQFDVYTHHESWVAKAIGFIITHSKILKILVNDNVIRECINPGHWILVNYRDEADWLLFITCKSIYAAVLLLHCLSTRRILV